MENLQSSRNYFKTTVYGHKFTMDMTMYDLP